MDQHIISTLIKFAVPTMEFLKTDVEVKENKKILSLAIKREGDIKSSSSVICYTRHATADVEEDFNERAKTETSRVTFKEGQKVFEIVY